MSEAAACQTCQPGQMCAGCQERVASQIMDLEQTIRVYAEQKDREAMPPPSFIPVPPPFLPPDGYAFVPERKRSRSPEPSSPCEPPKKQRRHYAPRCPRPPPPPPSTPPEHKSRCLAWVRTTGEPKPTINIKRPGYHYSDPPRWQFEWVDYIMCDQPCSGPSCSHHRCIVKDCVMPRSIDSRDYCTSHACRRCLYEAALIDGEDGSIMLCDHCAPLH
jgi:hypothetical protein